MRYPWVSLELDIHLPPWSKHLYRNPIDTFAEFYARVSSRSNHFRFKAVIDHAIKEQKVQLMQFADALKEGAFDIPYKPLSGRERKHRKETIEHLYSLVPRATRK